MTYDINHCELFKVVRANDFEAMVAVERYGPRNTSFDSMVSKTNEHFWNPHDSDYVDYTIKFDLNTQLVLPTEMFPEFRSPLIQVLDIASKIALANENARWVLSAILHGEQAALLLCSQLVNRLVEPGAQEYAANQAREEARHVAAFSRYISVRWDTPYPVGDALGDLLRDVLRTQHIYKKLIGMQILVEGLAMGLFAVVHATTTDALLKRITQLVLTDEAFHHKFGKTWAEKTIPFASKEERNKVEDWTAICFEKLYLNLNHIEQRRDVHEKFGLDHVDLVASLELHESEQVRRNRLFQQGNIFRSLLGNLVRAEIVTARTRSIYARWLDVDQLEREDDALEAIGAVISKQGKSYLSTINSQPRAKKRNG